MWDDSQTCFACHLRRLYNGDIGSRCLEKDKTFKDSSHVEINDLTLSTITVDIPKCEYEY